MKSLLKFSIAGLVLAALTFNVHATPGGEGNNTGCNGVGNANSPCTGTGNSGGAGGAGGQGGAGGTGIGVGVGIAAAQANAAAVAAANANAAANQVQGQQQGQTQSSRNTAIGGAGGRANATGGNATGGNAAGGAGGNSGGNTLSTGAVAVTVEGAKGDTYVAPAQERNPVATAYAAPLTSSPETCMGSSSGGVQGGSLGVSFGTTWESAKCDRRMDARTLHALGYTAAAVSRMCQGEENVKAMEDGGTPCPTSKSGKRAESILNGTQSAAAYQQVTTASIPTLLP